MSSPCTHLHTIRTLTPSALGCEECLAMGDEWVHLRICRTCGPAATSDAAPTQRTSTRPGTSVALVVVGHRAQASATQHPIIEGYDPPEGWGWCFVDEALLDLSDRKTPHNGPIPRYI